MRMPKFNIQAYDRYLSFKNEEKIMLFVILIKP